MGAESVVKASVIYDTEQMQEGVQETVDGLQQMAEQAAVTSDTMVSKSQAMARAAKDAAATVSEADIKSATAARALAVAKKEATAAARDLAKGLGIESDALILSAAAMARKREATMAAAAAERELAGASEHVVPEMAASSAAVRTLGGALPIRAIERFVGTSLGLGPILMKAFPYIGAVDLGIELVKAGMELWNVGEKAKEARDALTRAFADMGDKLDTNNDKLALTNSKLEDEIAKVSKHPTNGLQTALLEAKVAADDLQTSLMGDVRELQKLLKESDTSTLTQDISRMVSGGADSSGAVKDVSDKANKLQDESRKKHDILDQELLDAQAAHAKAMAASRGNHDAIKSADDAFRQSQLAAQKKYNEDSANLYAAFARDMRKNATDLAAVEKATGGDLTKLRQPYEAAALLGDRSQRKVELSAQNETDNATLGQAKQNKPSGGGADKAAEERLRAMEEERVEEEQQGKLGAKADYDFWVQRIAAFAKGSSEYHQVQEKVTRDAVEGAKAAHEAIDKFKKDSGKDDDLSSEAANKGIADFNKLLMEQAEDVTRTGERWEGYNRELAKGQEYQAKLAEDLEQSRIKMLESTGGISAVAAAQMMAKIHTEEHTRAVKALEVELLALQAISANMKPGDKGYEQNQQQQAGLRNQIAQQQGAGQVQGSGDQSTIAAAMSKPYLTAFSDINNAWLKTQNDLIKGNANIKRDFSQLSLHLVQSMAGSFEKMLVSQAQMEVRSVMAHAVAQQQKTAATAVGATASGEINQRSALKEIFMHAKTAAAGAYKAMAPIPIVGPELGALAAAVTFAGVMSLAAFEKGGVVGGSPGMAVPILAHSGERVLSTSQTSKFESMVNNSSTGGGDHLHFHMGGNTYHGGNANQGMGNERQFRQTVARMHREGKLSFAK